MIACMQIIIILLKMSLIVTKVTEVIEFIIQREMLDYWKIVNNGDCQKKKTANVQRLTFETIAVTAVFKTSIVLVVVNLHQRWEIYNTPYVVHKG